jgi:dihydroorotate dehydrogenase electron transfer subunit
VSVAAPAIASALVTGLRPLGAYRVLALEAPEIAASCLPGQFVTIGLDPSSEHLLRRPFSVYRAFAEEGLIEIAFDVIGPGTRWIAGQKACFEVSVTGPLGTPFTLPAGTGEAMLVGGGYGTSALYELAVALRRTGWRTHLLAGAATASRVFAPDEDLFDRVTIATDDGSRGTRGLVTDAMRDAIASRAPDAVFACGPMAMLAAVSRLCAQSSLPIQVATEEFMACGVGVCWTCVVPVRTDAGLRHLRCCTEGPVFDGTAVEWR